MTTDALVRRPSRRGADAVLDGMGRTALLASIAVLTLCGGHLASSGLPSWAASQEIVSQSLFLGVLAFGQGLVMLIGGLDLSAPGIIATSSTIAVEWTTADHHNVYVGLVLAIAASAAIGLINGLLVARFRIPAFIVTLAIGTITVGFMTGWTLGNVALASPSVLQHWFSGSGKAFGIALPVFVFVALAAVGYLIQSKSRFGRQVYLMGSSREAARLAGCPVFMAEVGVYVTSAVAAGIAGLMLLGFSGDAQIYMGNDWQMPTIAAVLIGGTVIGSGRGAWGSTLAACVLLTTITVVIQATGVSQAWKSVLYGVVVLAALFATGGVRSLRLLVTRSLGRGRSEPTIAALGGSRQ